MLFISVDWEVRGMWGDDAHCYILIIRSVTNTLPLSLSRNENIKQRVSGLCDPLRFHTITHYQFCTPNASLLIPYLILMRTDEHLTLYWGRRELLRKREIYTHWKLVTSLAYYSKTDCHWFYIGLDKVSGTEPFPLLDSSSAGVHFHWFHVNFYFYLKERNVRVTTPMPFTGWYWCTVTHWLSDWLTKISGS